MAKKKRNPKVQFAEDNNSYDAKKILPEVKAASLEPDHHPDQLDAEPQIQVSDSVQATLTSSESIKKRLGGARGVAAIHKVVVKKAKGKKCKIRYNELGVPIGANRPTLQSYIGMTARTMIPIDIPSWPDMDPELKAKLWLDVQDTFNITPEFEEKVLKSAGAKWRQFKSNLTTTHVEPYIGQKKQFKKPPKMYAFVGKDVWKRFVAERTSKNLKDELLENKEKGEFIPSGSNGVLTKALETPEHSGRVRGVGGFVTPKLFFNLLRKKRSKISKEDLSDESERQKKEIYELKAMISASHLGSPMLSNKSSCQPLKEDSKAKPEIVKELMVDNEKELMVNNEQELMMDNDCFSVDPPPPTEKEVNSLVHGQPLPPGCVCVDGRSLPRKRLGSCAGTR